MEKSWWYKFWFTICVIILSFAYLIPTFMGDKTPEWYKKLNDRRIRLGLDLQGGMHLVLGVDIDKAISDKADSFATDLESILKEKGIEFNKIERVDDSYQIKISFKSHEHAVSFEEKVIKEYPQFTIVNRGGNDIIIDFNDEYVANLKMTAIDQAMKTLTNRVDEFGVAERSIAKKGDNAILVQLPGLTDPERAKGLLGQTAQLEFKLVEDTVDLFSQYKDNLPEGITFDRAIYEGKDGQPVTEHYLVSKDKEKLLNFIKGVDTKGYQIVLGKEQRELETYYRTYVVQKKTPLTGEFITRTDVLIDHEENRPYVGLSFDVQGAKIFEKLTGDNVGRRMAIVLDNFVDSAPVIKEKISGGNARITLGAMKSYEELLEEANDLAIVLRSGALPAPVEILEERTVGPTLGKDSIDKGIKSIVIGTLLVLLFMMIYYKLSGLIADFALVLNLFLILAIMAFFEATLTLPGMAGLVLTLAMAVDANVLINERIREEVRAGKTPKAAIEVGYGKVFWTIFDANLTTLISAIILFQFGTGPIRGFAVTVTIGIIASMFTAIVVTRLVMDRIYHSHKIEKISI
ncbi:MAG: protein translocase subunit SecD [Deltaproteobacteria bacterium]|nr:protein translocase subunit SecD [Deltaproteobacteria bacterium]